MKIELFTFWLSWFLFFNSYLNADMNVLLRAAGLSMAMVGITIATMFYWKIINA